MGKFKILTHKRDLGVEVAVSKGESGGSQPEADEKLLLGDAKVWLKHHNLLNFDDECQLDPQQIIRRHQALSTMQFSNLLSKEH